MAKRKLIRTNPVVYDPPGFTAEENETRYKKDYEFNKRAPLRSPIEGWSYKYTIENNSMAPPKEIALAKGTPHKFKGVRTANPYTRSRPAIKRSK